MASSSSSNSRQEAIRFALGRGQDFVDLDPGENTLRGEGHAPPPANGALWTDKSTEARAREQLSAGYSLEWIREYIRRKRAVSGSCQNRFLIRVAGGVGLSDFSSLLQPPLSPSALKTRQVAELRLLEDELKRRAAIKPETVQEVRRLKKLREERSAALDAARLSIASINSSAGQLRIADLWGSKFYRERVEPLWTDISALITSLSTLLSNVPGGGRTATATATTATATATTDTTAPSRVPFRDRLNNLASQFTALDPAIVLRILGAPGIPARFRSALDVMLSMVDLQAELHVKLRDIAAETGVSIVGDGAIPSTSSTPVPKVVEILPARPIGGEDDSFTVLIQAVQGYMYGLELGGDESKITISMKRETATVLRYAVELVDNIIAAAPAAVRDRSAVLDANSIISMIDRISLEDLLTAQQSTLRWKQTVGAAWRSVLRSMKAERLVDSDMPELDEKRKSDLAAANRDGDMVASLTAEDQYADALREVVQSVIISMPPSHPFLLSLARNNSSSSAVLSDPEGRLLFEQWKIYLETSRVRSLQRELIDTNQKLSELIQANSVLTEIDALRKRDGTVDEDVVRRMVDPIRHDLAYAMDPANSGFEDVKDSVLSAIDSAVEHLMSLPEIRDRIIKDDQDAQEAFNAHQESGRKRKRGDPEDAHLIPLTVKQKELTRPGKSALTVFQHSLVVDDRVFVVFADMVAMKLSLNTDFFPRGWRRNTVTDSSTNRLLGQFKKLVTEFDFSWCNTKKRYVFRRLTSSESETKKAEMLAARRESHSGRKSDAVKSYYERGIDSHAHDYAPPKGRRRYGPSRPLFYGNGNRT